MKPKYSVEQILEAVEASHLPLFVMCVDEEKVEVGNPYVDTSLTVVSNADGLLAEAILMGCTRHPECISVV